MSNPEKLADVASCVDGYDPHALPVALAQTIIERFIAPVRDTELVALPLALDRVLAQTVISPIDVPAHDNSAMDGYALRSTELVTAGASGSTRFRIVGTALAGRPFLGTVAPGEAIRIMTGAVLPPGLDTVVPQEHVRTHDGLLEVPAGQSPGQHCRQRGEDLARGQVALAAGRVLGPADIGLLASLGVGEVSVVRRLRVAIFSTGDELQSVGSTLAPGQVYDSNRYTLLGMLQRLGVELIDLGVVPDCPEALEAAMRQAATRADAIVSSGGVSVGEADFTRDIMARLGDVTFWTIAMRPGRPMAFGRVGDAYYFGLPGNPVAVMITFYFFARDALRRLAGASPRTLPMFKARSARAIRKKAGRTEYQRGIVAPDASNDLVVTLTGGQGSGILSSMSQANCIVVLSHAQGEVRAGEWVDCVPFEGLL